jgi:hypothetical protein
MKKKGRGMSIFASIVEGDYKDKADESRQVRYLCHLHLTVNHHMLILTMCTHHLLTILTLEYPMDFLSRFNLGMFKW